MWNYRSFYCKFIWNTNCSLTLRTANNLQNILPKYRNTEYGICTIRTFWKKRITRFRVNLHWLIFQRLKHLKMENRQIFSWSMFMLRQYRYRVNVWTNMICLLTWKEIQVLINITLFCSFYLPLVFYSQEMKV